MIQFKKKPSKSVLILLLFLTINVHGFLQENQSEYRESRKTQNRFSMDLQQPTTRNMPIRRIGIDRVINEKDRNTERLYDRRSFRTGTIESIKNVLNSERTIESREATSHPINNRESFIRTLRNTRDIRQTVESSNPRENHQAQNDRRTSDRAVAPPTRQYTERLHSKNDRRIETSHRDERESYNHNQRIDSRRNIRKNAMIERQESESRQFDNRRTVERELPQKQRLSDNRSFTRTFPTRRFDERLERMSNRDNTLDLQYLRTSDNHQHRQAMSGRLNPRGSLDRRSAENRNIRENHATYQQRVVDDSSDRRLTRRVSINQRRLSNDRRMTERIMERLNRDNSRRNPTERRFTDDTDRRNLSSNLEQRRTSFEDRTRSRERFERVEIPSQIRSAENKNHQNRFTERFQRTNARSNNIERRSAQIQDRRTDRNQHTDRRDTRGHLSVKRDNTPRESQELSRVRQFIANSGERRDQRLSERRGPEARIANRYQEIYPKGNRVTSLQNRLVDNRASLAEPRYISDVRSSRRSRDIGTTSSQTRMSDRSERIDSRDTRSASGRLTDSRERLSERREALVRLSGTSERRRQRLSEASDRVADARSSDSSERFSSRDTRRISSQIRVDNRQRVAERHDQRRITDSSVLRTRSSNNLENGRRFSRDGRTNTREVSRSDSTRYLQDNVRSRDIRLKDSRVSDKSILLALNSQNRFDKIDSQRTYRNSEMNTDAPALNFEKDIQDNTYTWASAAKMVLAAFLIGQIFVNSSKSNKFRFHNILSTATSFKEKIH